MLIQCKRYGKISTRTFLVPNVPRFHEIKAEIASYKQKGHELVDFFSKLISLWNKLENYVKISMCTCEAIEKMAKMMEDKMIHSS